MNITVFQTITEFAVIQCIEQIVQNHASRDDFIGVTNVDSNLNFTSLRIDYGKSMESDLYNFYPRRIDFYIIEEYNLEKLMNLIVNLQNITGNAYNPGGKFLFVVKSLSSVFLELISTYNIVNAIFFNLITKEIFTYFPFKRHILNSVDTNFEKMGTCWDTHWPNLFPPKVPNFWVNSSISIAVSIQNAYSLCIDCKNKGIDMETLNIILNYSGIHGIFHVVKERNLLYTEDSYDIAIGNCAPKDPKFGGPDITYPYTDDPFIWVIPKPNYISRWKYYARIFDVTVCIVSIASILSLSFLWDFGKILFLGRISIWASLTVPRSVFTLFLAQSFIFKTNFIHHRILTIFIIFLSFMMSLFFSTRLTYLLNGLHLDGKINNFEEMLNHGLIIGCPKSVMKIFNKTTRVVEYLERNLVDCDLTNKCLKRVAYERDMAACKTVRRLRFEGLLDNNTGEWLVQELYPPIYVRHVVMFFRRNTPIFHLFNSYLSRLVQSGIIGIIVKKYEKMAVIKDVFLAPAQKLKLEHIAGPLVAWLIGNIFGGIILFVEQNRNRVKSKIK
ncbi:hypothetical protein HHI36_022183 [Cryptolaemus montrouzieri]|uniref:Uncharacterized protein n=1 Tax=Cryptolaemus montrouzieri TaxID=559131 RepID=A0ABD2MZB2_9CUCU